MPGEAVGVDAEVQFRLKTGTTLYDCEWRFELTVYQNSDV